MAILVDTGILLRAFDKTDPAHAAVRKSLRAIEQQRIPVYTAVQNVAEFWNVATRPLGANGFGWPAKEVRWHLKTIELLCVVAVENAQSYRHWKSLVEQYSITGVAVHDCRLVSVMLAEGIPRILTLNVRDFQRYAEIEAVSPATLAKEL